MSQFKAVIFDMDGVLVDSESSHEQAYLDVVNALGYGDNHGLRFTDYLGRSDDLLWRDFIALHHPPQTFEELLALKTQRVVEIIRRDQPLFEGVPELVKELAGKYRLALASGSERAIVEEVLAMRGLRRFFSATISGSDIKHGKPDPEIFLRAACLLGVAPADCCVIEDSKPGVAAALAAGMPVIAITNTHPAAQLSHATQVVKTYKEIEQALSHGDEAS